MRGLLLVNPRSGDDRPSADDLVRAANDIGVEVHLLVESDDATELARSSGADVLGMAGGDGSLGAVAQVAIERGIPFVCVPFGTRNHFARDAGLDRDDPQAALAAFTSGAERRVDVGHLESDGASGRVFLNNVSLGLYASIVERRERHRRRGALLARIRALRLSAHDRRPTEFVVDGIRVAARILLVGNNEYRLDAAAIGERSRLDGGTLHLYLAKGILPGSWRTLAPRVTVTITSERAEVPAAVDGEPISLRPPLRIAIEPGALRLLVPPR